MTSMTSIKCLAARTAICLLAVTTTVRGQTNTSPVVIGTCDSTMEEADMMVQLTPTLTFHWTLMDDPTPVLDGVLEYDGEGWLGFGVSPTGEMIGSTAIIGLPGTGAQPAQYSLESKSEEGVTQPVPLTSPEKAVITQAGGKTILRFVKVLKDEANGGGFLTESGLNTFIFAAGSTNELGYHLHRGSFRINLESCDESTGGSTSDSSSQMTKQGAFAAHGMLAVLAWGVATPFAVTVAWFRTLVPSSWIYIHVFSNVLSFLFTLVAVIVAITAKSDQADPAHFTKPHHIVGVTLLVLMTFQVFSGFMRPPVEKKATHYNDGHGWRIPRSPREIWYFAHRFSGVSMLAMGVYQIISGLNLYADDFGVTSIAPWFWLYVGLFAFFLIALKVWIMLEEHKAREATTMLPSEHMIMDPGSDASYDLDHEEFNAPAAQFVPT